MIACDPKNPKKRRNFLLDELNNYQAESGNKPLKILDFGCGPGNILDYLQESQIREVKEIFGLDSSAKALRIAEKKGQRVGASFCSGERRHARLLGD
jgi:ubiquinone/menaquinone biosynthesis C-methylase UbiE